jgi:3-dehydroquinate synthase
MTRLHVAAPSREYDIAVGENAVNTLPAEAERLKLARRAAVVTDENVWRLHGEKLRAALDGAEMELLPVVLPPGEGSKTLQTAERLYHAFAEFSLKRNETVIAFGGGVVGDLAGFAAATYMRGTPFVQIPTTVVAQIDSSVGGKTGVNLGEGKNLVGCFYQPELVLADTALLATLPKREIDAGMAEAVKYAALGERGLFPILSRKGELSDFEELVRLCCRAKAKLVEADECDTGARRALNFGHTFGHAIEKYYNYGKFNHGEAVARGIAIALDVGVALGVTPEKTRGEALALMEARGLDTALEIPRRELIPLTASDKKNENGAVTLILLKGVGEPVVYKTNEEELWKLL